MGKVRKRKPNKINVNVSANISEEEELPVDSKENAIQTIIDQLQSANVEEKYCGLQTFAMFVESPQTLEQIIDRGLVKIVGPLLLDQAASIRNAAAGSLRNLSAVKLEMCDVLMDHDIMTPLICYFHQYTESWTPDLSSKSKDEEIDTFIQCTNLLLNMCESSDIAVKYVGDSKILDIFPRYLELSTFGYEIVTTVMQCLFVIVEDNALAIDKVKLYSERQLTELLSLEGSDPSVFLLKTLAGGIVINLCGGNIASLPINVMNQIIEIMGKTLSVDHRLACNQLSSSVPLDTSQKLEDACSKETLQLNNQIKSVSQLLDAQQKAIEIIANICASNDPDDNAEEFESSDSDINADDDISNSDEGTLLPEDKLSPAVLEAMVSLEIFHKIWARTQLPAENVLLILKEYDGTQLLFKKLHSLQVRSLLCINNVVLTLPLENLGGINGIYKVWVEAGKLAFKQSSENLELLEAATAVMRTVLDKMSVRDQPQSESSVFSNLALSDIEIMLIGIKDCQVPEIRSNLIRMIGILALLLVNNLNDTTSNVVCCITEFILEQAHKENEVWVLAEAIDTLIDLYSEDETNALAVKVKLVEKLTILAPILRNKARQQKKLPKEYKVLVTTANSNLPRFIKYKKDIISKL